MVPISIVEEHKVTDTQMSGNIQSYNTLFSPPDLRTPCISIVSRLISSFHALRVFFHKKKTWDDQGYMQVSVLQWFTLLPLTLGSVTMSAPGLIPALSRS